MRIITILTKILLLSTFVPSSSGDEMEACRTGTCECLIGYCMPAHSHNNECVCSRSQDDCIRRNTEYYGHWVPEYPNVNQKRKSLGECQIQRTGNMFGSGYPDMRGGVDPWTLPDGSITYAGDDFLEGEVYFEATPCQFEGPDKIFVEIFANPTEGIGGSCDSGTSIASQDLKFTTRPFDEYTSFFNDMFFGPAFGPCFPITYNGRVGRATFKVSKPAQSGINKGGYIDMCVRVSVKREVNGELVTASFTDTVVKQNHDESSSGHIFNYVAYGPKESFNPTASYVFYDPNIPCVNECSATGAPQEVTLPEDCKDDIKLYKTIGETSYPNENNPVEIIAQEKSSVTVNLYQNWPSSAPIERIFYSYYTNPFSSKCFEEVNVAQGSSITEAPIKITCGFLNSLATLEICLQDSNLKPGDNASIARCCHSDAVEGTPEASAVCYRIEINCESACTADSIRRNLRTSE